MLAGGHGRVCIGGNADSDVDGDGDGDDDHGGDVDVAGEERQQSAMTVTER